MTDWLSRRYIFALGLIAVLTVSSLVVIRGALGRQESDASVINIAGRQRMLSQQLAKTARQIEGILAHCDRSETAELSFCKKRQARVDEMRAVLDLWTSSHLGLQDGDVELNLPGSNTPEVVELFARVEPHYLAMCGAVENLLAVAGAAPDLRKESDTCHLLGTIERVEPSFLAGMGAIVIRYQVEAQARIAQLKRVDLILMSIVLLVLLLEALLVFRPAVRRIQRKVEEMAEGEERLRLTLDAVSDGGWDWNVATGEVCYSDRWLQSLGYERDESAPHISFWEGIIHPDDTQRVTDVLNAHLKGRTPNYECEMRLRAASGDYRWNLDRGKVVARDGTGRALRMVGTGTDITERKQVEETLLRVNQRLRTGVDQMPIAYILWDDQFRVIEWNPAAERIFGYSKSEMVGKYPLDYIVAEPARPLVHSVIEKLLAGEAASYSEVGNNLRKDGEVISCNWYNTPLKDKTGTTVAVLSMAIDVTERRRSERELLKLSAAVEQSPAVIVITDTSGTIEYVNPRFTEVTGYAYEEAIGQNPRILKSGKLAKKAYQGLWETILAGKTWRGEFENEKKSGELYWEAASISPIRDSEGSITHFLAVKEDITERKRAEEELRQAKDAAEVASKAKSEFLANMSHEIRTPMTAILGFAENLLDSDQSESEMLDTVHTIRRNGENLLNIVNDILDLSKIEAGKMTTSRMDCHPCQIVAEVASLMRVRSDATGLAFNIEYIGEIPETIQSDPTRLRQILINLVGNAIKFTEVGSVRLVVRFVDDGDAPRMQFDVIDTGRGMTDDQAANLFQPFTQANTSTAREYGGTGLGLTISKRFAELLGGEVVVVATEMGVGTTFRATVATGSLTGVTMIESPLSATLVEHSGPDVEQASPSSLCGLRILLAEDGPDNQRLISSVLEKAGADVTVAENGKIALDTALAAMNGSGDDDSTRPFDLILMDIQMPVMDGYEATGQLRQKGYTGPIIAITAHAMGGDREKCIRAGCDDYATKPIHRARLVEKILRNLVTARTASPAAT